MEEIKARAFEARDSYKAGLITRLEAKEMIMPYIKLYNEKSKQIAKKYNMKARCISFVGFVR